MIVGRRPIGGRRATLIALTFLLLLPATEVSVQLPQPTELSIEPGVSLQATLRNQEAKVDVVGCPDISGPLALGRGAFTLQLGLKPGRTMVALDPAKDDQAQEKLCHYREIEAGSLTIETAGLAGSAGDPFHLSPTIDSVDISAYRRENARLDDRAAFTEVSLGWTNSGTDQIPLNLERFGISFQVYSFGATFTTSQPNGDLALAEGSIEIQFSADGAVQLQGPVYLAGNIESTIEYSWKPNATSWTDGTWDLSGLGGVRLEVRRDGVVPIAVLGLSFDTNYIARGVMQFSDSKSWEVNGFALQLDGISLEAEIDMRNNTWRLVQGSIDGAIRTRRPVDGDFRFLLAYRNSHFEMEIASNSKVSAFGVSCEDLALRVDLNAETLEFHEIGGSVAFKHADFGAAVRIASFLVRDGSLITFLGSGQVRYRGFLVNISEISYNAAIQPAELGVRASLDVGWSSTGTGTIDIENFKIDERGTISSFSIRSAVTAPPVNVRFAASFDQARSEFSGRFEGSFAGTAHTSNLGWPNSSKQAATPIRRLFAAS